MKILISIGSLGLGGAEKQAVWLANQFAANNDVTLITYYGGKRESELSSNVKWLRLIPESSSEQSHESPTKSLEDSKHDAVATEANSGRKIFILREPKSGSAKKEIRLWIKIYIEKSKIATEFINKILSVINKILSGLLLIRSLREAHHLISNTQPKFVVTFLYHDTLILGLATLLRMKRIAYSTSRIPSTIKYP